MKTAQNYHIVSSIFSRLYLTPSDLFTEQIQNTAMGRFLVIILYLNTVHLKGIKKIQKVPSQ